MTLDHRTFFLTGEKVSVVFISLTLLSWQSWVVDLLSNLIWLSPFPTSPVFKEVLGMRHGEIILQLPAEKLFSSHTVDRNTCFVQSAPLDGRSIADSPPKKTETSFNWIPSAGFLFLHYFRGSKPAKLEKECFIQRTKDCLAAWNKRCLISPSCCCDCNSWKKKKKEYTYSTKKVLLYKCLLYLLQSLSGFQSSSFMLKQCKLVRESIRSSGPLGFEKSTLNRGESPPKETVLLLNLPESSACENWHPALGVEGLTWCCCSLLQKSTSDRPDAPVCRSCTNHSALQPGGVKKKAKTRFMKKTAELFPCGWESPCGHTFQANYSFEVGTKMWQWLMWTGYFPKFKGEQLLPLIP